MALVCYFSSNLESHADKSGIMLMVKAGYNPNAAATLWQKMNKNNGSSNNTLFNFMSTHLSNEDRIGNFQKLMPEAIALYKK